MYYVNQRRFEVKKNPFFIIGVMCVAWLALSTQAQALPTFFGPTPYLSLADSPFDTSGLGATFFLEDFEDNALNTLGATSAGGNPTGPGGITDSVDIDADGINGTGVNGRSYFGNGAAGITFFFDDALLGGFPTEAGIVWTDGATFNTVTFEAFDSLGVSLGTVVGNNIGDGDFLSGTDEDRFFGVRNPGGISRIHINSVGLPNTSGSGIEVDHLQYNAFVTVDTGNPGAVPEPVTATLGALGLGALAMATRRRRSA